MSARGQVTYLFLTKPLGTGVITTAFEKRSCHTGIACGGGQSNDDAKSVGSASAART